MKTLSIAAMLAALLHIGAGTSDAQIGFPHDQFAGPSAHGGTMLGIYAVETIHGLQIMGTVEGFSAHGRLLPNDVLLRATAANLPCFSIISHDRMQYAKMMIGANRVAAIEFFRPGVGNMYAWMTFELQTNVPHSALLGVTPGVGTTFTAEFVLESERPGAQLLFAAPVVAPVTDAVAPVQTPGVAPIQTPGVAPVQAPGVAPIQTPGAAPVQTPNAVPPVESQAPPIAPIQPAESSPIEAAIDALLK